MKETTPTLASFPTRPYKLDNLRLGIGHRLQIEVPNQGEPFVAKLLGYLKAETLMIRPISRVPLGRLPLVEGAVVTVRGFSGRVAFVFQTRIEQIRYAPYTYCHLKYPASVQGSEIRHSERVRVDLPVRVAGVRLQEGAEAEATIADISAAGAMLVAESPLGEVGDRVTLTFRFWVMPNDYEVNMNVAAVIQSIAASEQEGGGNRYGVKFEAMRSTEGILLQNLIFQRLQEGTDASA